MANIDLGSTIRRLRKQKGITQEALAAHIMDVSTLSRIERGLIMPSKRMLEALFGRLGYDPNKIANYFLSGEEVNLQKIIDKMETAIGYRKADELRILIPELESSKKYMELPLNKQYVLFARSALELIEKNLQQAFELLGSAIKITIPDFNASGISDYLLTEMDRRIISVMAITQKNMGNLELAVEMYYGVKNNYDRHIVDRVDFGRGYSIMLFNLVMWLVDLERFEEALKLCGECKKICIETGFGFVLPSVTCYEAIARHELGLDGCEELLMQAYYGCVLFELHKDSEFVKKVAKERFGLLLV